MFIIELHVKSEWWHFSFCTGTKWFCLWKDQEILVFLVCVCV